ncbi:MAG: 16S rRNA (adenine(1518)-N(6)/adenine(1519)-N(6))-dimethyltransferase RsmA [Planctomycetota bacterium]|nr:16S rRNA (adenine(1518)-N(6)/adenine(1519)-N(6))-dimethyltransferase RsmA [Planctomycetota bacterium]
MLTKTELKQILTALGRNPNKKLGQVFLTSRNIVSRIAEAAVFYQKDCAVFELGGGLGNLTEALSHHAAWVFSVEIDKKLAENTKMRLANLENVTVICADAIEHGRIRTDLLKQFLQGVHKRHLSSAVFCSNIPYCISGAVLLSLPLLPHPFSFATLMTQKEVFERISASPGSKNFGLLSILLQRFFKIKKLFDVPRRNFYPIPEVDSTVVRLEFIRRVANHQEYEQEISILERIFRFRRKTLLRSLELGFALEHSKASHIIESVGDVGAMRAEQLPAESFWTLVGVLKSLCPD